MDYSSIIGREPMLEMYIFEENQLLEQLEEIMLSVEKKNSMSKDNVNEIFRIMHTIKGSSAMMLFNEIATMAHAVEDLFFLIRSEPEKAVDYSELCDLVLAVSDFIRTEISKVEEGRTADGKDDGLVTKIRRMLAVMKGQPVPEEPPKAIPPADRYYIRSAPPEADDVKKYVLKVHFEEGCQMENIRAFSIVHNLKESSLEILHRPADIISDPNCSEEIIRNGFDIYLTTSAGVEEINRAVEEAIFVKDFTVEVLSDYEALVRDLRSVPAPACVEAAVEPPEIREEQKSIKQDLITVNLSKLDILMDLVGEIVITESMVTRNPDLDGLHLENFGKAARQLRKLTDELQDIVMAIRMVPVAGVFQKMNRIVRDMGKKLSKDVNLILVGEDTELDKSILDLLGDPLMHLIRNAMDHGIEDKATREELGKPLQGTVVLEAKNSGSDVIITIRDDGKGLDRDRILEKAREKGLIAKPDSEISDKEAYSLILLPGFSTKENVSEFSGRGVGMDVVKQNIEKVGGSIQVESTPGRGSVISIRIPLTLAIIDGMEVSVGNSRYTIPTIAIKESFRPESGDIILDPHGNELIMIRGNCYPIIRLHEVFGKEPRVRRLEEGIIVMTENDREMVCLFADQLLGEQQVVVKPLPPYITRFVGSIKGISGCTILGNGEISLIVDVNGF